MLNPQSTFNMHYHLKQHHPALHEHYLQLKERKGKVDDAAGYVMEDGQPGQAGQQDIRASFAKAYSQPNFEDAVVRLVVKHESFLLVESPEYQILDSQFQGEAVQG